MYGKRSGTPSLLTGLALLLLAACGVEEPHSAAQPAGQEGEKVSTIEGEVFYRERMMLPPGSELEVQLQDISRADALARVMETVMLPLEGAPPYAFAIDYNPQEIDPRMRYALRATISRSGRLLFTSTDYIDPFAQAPLEIMLQRVAEPVDKASAEAAPEQTSGDAQEGERAVWVLQTLAGLPAGKGAGGQSVDLSMDADSRNASGFSGCNRYSGNYSTQGKSALGTAISFGPLAVTRRLCPEGGELEQSYLKMLESVDAYRMQGDTLELMHEGDIVATFSLR